jgi:predicted regulator of Ras-like GTPase activity (Roadblock/LC7/MglB family)
MQENVTVSEELREIENVTNINGCFLLRARDNAIIDSTLPLKIPDEILWEIAVLRDTFQQFSSGVEHGSLKNITLEGERGYIFIYNLPPQFILLAMGAKDLNLSIIQFAMLDILQRINRKIEILGETLLNAPAKAFAAVGEGAAIPALVTSEEKGKIPKEIPAVSSARVAAQARAALAEAREREPFIPVPAPITPVEQPPATVTPVEQPPVVSFPVQLGVSIPETLPELKGKSQAEKNTILSAVFERLKVDVKTAKGAEVAALLEMIKDAVLENFGTSLALFDISRNARDFKNVHAQLTPQQVLLLRDRIMNWAQRIIK